jgi:hypothetical protein
MTGLLLIAVVIAWVSVIFMVARRIARRMNSSRLGILAGVSLFVILLVAPVADELVGDLQFASLCSKYATQFIDEQNAMNRHVLYQRRGVDEFADGTAVSVRIDPTVYIDTETKKVVVSYHTLHAEGGWFIRALGISATGAPLLFNGNCAPKDQDAFKKKYNISVVN